METQAYPSKIVMLQDLAKRVEGLDVNASAFFPRFSFVTDKGETHLCPIVMTFVQEFNKAFGNVLDINGCRTVSGGRGKCILTFLEKEDFDKEDTLDKTESVIEEVVEEFLAEAPLDKPLVEEVEVVTPEKEIPKTLTKTKAKSKTKAKKKAK